MQKKELIKPAMLDPPGLAANVAVLNMDLRGLREAGELLVGRLSCDDPRLAQGQVRVSPWRSDWRRWDETS